MPSIDWGAVLTGLITSAIVGVGGSLVVRSTKWGQGFWNDLAQGKRIRTVASLAAIALLLSLSALIALVIRSQSLDVYSGDKVFAYKNPPPDPNWAASGSCPSDSKVIGFYCQIGDGQVNPAGSGNLQNLGVMDGKSFHCLWNNVVGANFRAWGKPLCLRLKK